MSTESAEDAAPLDVRVVRGTPTDEELAAVLAVLQATATPSERRETPKRRTPSGWERSIRDLRAHLPSTWH
ncbi:acyl-CoA carboxylase subunit epsilon [Naasia aerilata]|uniref:Acyl-CoA carboxylase epsilon subunit-like protein n=1 Tax=Naasia aerilata TaxID=1162966 RepID=A0ABN6XQH9_9MICO|nr:acyl-CoA carboxylase subunit epsilon [Naasia aerilata]BDZ45875.1 hypothetical protein GCM10025866_17840 [Naasia aerilata]